MDFGALKMWLELYCRKNLVGLKYLNPLIKSDLHYIL